MHLEPTSRKEGSLLRRIFWLPVACLAAVELYSATFDGWGAWATAPLFLLPLVLSLAIAAAGAYDAFSEARSDGPRASTVVFTIVAATPFAWLMVRRFFV